MVDAILGTYSDFKLVKTRSVVQVVIEVPLERAQEVTDLFGLPVPGAEIPVAMARLRTAANTDTPRDEPKPPAKLAQLAGIVCNEGRFWRFLSENTQYTIDSADEAAKYVRLVCGVRSHAELDTNISAANLWRDLSAKYEAWK